MPDVVLNGRTYSFATFVANSGYGYAAKDARGYQLWPDAIFFDMLEELKFVKAAGATSNTSLAIGTGSKAFTLNTAVDLPAGLYFIFRAAEPNTQTNYMFGQLTTAISASTSFTVTVPTGGTGGSGTYTDWIIVPAFAKRAPTREITGADTLSATDYGAVLRYSGAGGHTLAFTAAATLGVGFIATLNNDGTGDWTLDPASAETIDGETSIDLAPGESVLIWNTGSEWLVIGAKGYGAPAAVTPPITSTAATQTNDFTFAAGTRYPIANAAPKTGTLPTAPADGTTVEWFEAGDHWAANAFTIARGGSDTIDGDTSLVCNIRYRGRLRLTYRAATGNWSFS